ncbi:MAG: hypothetical protein ACKO2L_05165 [Planctomycetaceae bacterium]
MLNVIAGSSRKNKPTDNRGRPPTPAHAQTRPEDAPEMFTPASEIGCITTFKGSQSPKIKVF